MHLSSSRPLCQATVGSFFCFFPVCRHAVPHFLLPPLYFLGTHFETFHLMKVACSSSLSQRGWVAWVFVFYGIFYLVFPFPFLNKNFFSSLTPRPCFVSPGLCLIEGVMERPRCIWRFGSCWSLFLPPFFFPCHFSWPWVFRTGSIMDQGKFVLIPHLSLSLWFLLSPPPLYLPLLSICLHFWKSVSFFILHNFFSPLGSLFWNGSYPWNLNFPMVNYPHFLFYQFRCRGVFTKI